VILDSASSFKPNSNDDITTAQPQDESQHLLLLSASSAASLQKKAEELKAYVESKSPQMEDLAYTLALRREHLSYRSFVIGDSTGIKLPDQLSVSKSNSSRSITYVFTGQGAQWVGMGRDLLKTYDDFAQHIQRMDRVLQLLQCPPQWTIERRSFKQLEVLFQIC
jgi:acyl transferase domain-containing protein